MKKFTFVLAALAVAMFSFAQETVTISFGNGTGACNFKSASVDYTDAADMAWKMSAKASSFTPQSGYNQIGSSRKPATSITMTGTAAEAMTITSISVKMGGFSGTTGNVSIAVNGTSYATGALNAATDVTISGNTEAALAQGENITISVTGIAKGVKVYNITYAYKTASTASLVSLAISGEPTTTTYTVGKVFDPAGLVVTGTYDDETTKDVTDKVEWMIDPETLSKETTSVEVAAYIGDVMSEVFMVNGIVVKDPAVFVKCNSTIALKDGSRIIITNADATKALSATQKNNNRAAADITLEEDGTLLEDAEVEIITLKAVTGATPMWELVVPGGYLYAASSSSNYLKTQTTNDANGQWTIEIAETGVATIKAQGTYTHNLLRYNSSSTLFSCYTGGQDDVVIYAEKSSDETGIDNATEAVKAVKVIENGQMVIIRGGVKYNAQGAVIE